jgi:hypothetical protein
VKRGAPSAATGGAPYVQYTKSLIGLQDSLRLFETIHFPSKIQRLRILMASKRSDSFGERETQARLDVLMRGAFSGPPTELDAIPKKNGQLRSRAQRKRSISSSDANAKNDAPRKKNPT